MRNILYLTGVVVCLLLLSTCKSKPDDPLVIPPNFTEVPDPNNLEQVAPQDHEESVAKLKELLLESE